MNKIIVEQREQWKTESLKNKRNNDSTSLVVEMQLNQPWLTKDRIYWSFKFYEGQLSIKITWTLEGQLSIKITWTLDQSYVTMKQWTDISIVPV